jgi:hypothetical protein
VKYFPAKVSLCCAALQVKFESTISCEAREHTSFEEVQVASWHTSTAIMEQ